MGCQLINVFRLIEIEKITLNSVSFVFYSLNFFNIIPLYFHNGCIGAH